MSCASPFHLLPVFPQHPWSGGVCLCASSVPSPPLLFLSSSVLDSCQMTLFLKVMSDFPAVNAAINEAFPKNPPARSTVAVSDLPRNARVVVEVIAAQKPKT